MIGPFNRASWSKETPVKVPFNCLHLYGDTRFTFYTDISCQVEKNGLME